MRPSSLRGLTLRGLSLKTKVEGSGRMRRGVVLLDIATPGPESRLRLSLQTLYAHSRTLCRPHGQDARQLKMTRRQEEDGKQGQSGRETENSGRAGARARVRGARRARGPCSSGEAGGAWYAARTPARRRWRGRGAADAGRGEGAGRAAAKRSARRSSRRAARPGRSRRIPTRRRRRAAPP